MAGAGVQAARPMATPHVGKETEQLLRSLAPAERERAEFILCEMRAVRSRMATFCQSQAIACPVIRETQELLTALKAGAFQTHESFERYLSSDFAGNMLSMVSETMLSAGHFRYKIHENDLYLLNPDGSLSQFSLRRILYPPDEAKAAEAAALGDTYRSTLGHLISGFISRPEQALSLIISKAEDNEANIHLKDPVDVIYLYHRDRLDPTVIHCEQLAIPRSLGVPIEKVAAHLARSLGMEMDSGGITAVRNGAAPLDLKKHLAASLAELPVTSSEGRNHFQRMAEIVRNPEAASREYRSFEAEFWAELRAFRPVRPSQPAGGTPEVLRPSLAPLGGGAPSVGAERVRALERVSPLPLEQPQSFRLAAVSVQPRDYVPEAQVSYLSSGASLSAVPTAGFVSAPVVEPSGAIQRTVQLRLVYSELPQPGEAYAAPPRRLVAASRTLRSRAGEASIVSLTGGALQGESFPRSGVARRPLRHEQTTGRPYRPGLERALESFTRVEGARPVARRKIATLIVKLAEAVTAKSTMTREEQRLVRKMLATLIEQRSRPLRSVRGRPPRAVLSEKSKDRRTLIALRPSARRMPSVLRSPRLVRGARLRRRVERPRLVRVRARAVRRDASRAPQRLKPVIPLARRRQGVVSLRPARTPRSSVSRIVRWPLRAVRRRLAVLTTRRKGKRVPRVPRLAGRGGGIQPAPRPIRIIISWLSRWLSPRRARTSLRSIESRRSKRALNRDSVAPLIKNRMESLRKGVGTGTLMERISSRLSKLMVSLGLVRRRRETKRARIRPVVSRHWAYQLDRLLNEAVVLSQSSVHGRRRRKRRELEEYLLDLLFVVETDDDARATLARHLGIEPLYRRRIESSATDQSHPTS